MASAKQNFSNLKNLLSTVDDRHSKITNNLAEAQALDPCKCDPTDTERDSATEQIQRLLHTVDQDLYNLRKDTYRIGEITSEQLFSLYISEGLSYNEATVEAKGLVGGYIEQWLNFEEEAFAAKATLLGEECKPERLEFKQAEELHMWWEHNLRVTHDHLFEGQNVYKILLLQTMSERSRQHGLSLLSRNWMAAEERLQELRRVLDGEEMGEERLIRLFLGEENDMVWEDAKKHARQVKFKWREGVNKAEKEKDGLRDKCRSLMKEYEDK